MQCIVKMDDRVKSFEGKISDLRGILPLLIDAECFCGTKVKSGWLKAENLSNAVGSLFWVGIAI